MKVSLTLLLVAGGAVTAAALNATNQVAHRAALSESQETNAKLESARGLAAETRQQLAVVLAATATFSTRVTTFVSGTDGLMDGGAHTKLDEACTQLQKSATGIAADRKVDLATGGLEEKTIARRLPRS